MARRRDPQLDARLMGLLDGTDLAGKVGQVLQLVSVSADGAPHVALLSVGEVVAVSPRRLRMATWASSTSTANLRRHATCLMSLVLDSEFLGIELSVHADETVPAPEGLALFVADVQCVHRDAVDYAEVLGGITFRLVDPEPVLARWAATVDLLRQQEVVQR